MKKVILIVMLLTAVFLFTPKASHATIADPMWAGSTNFVGGSDWSALVHWAVWAPDTESLLGSLEDYSYYYIIVNSEDSTKFLKTYTVGNPWSASITDAGYIDIETAYPSGVDIEGTMWYSGVSPTSWDSAGGSIAYYFMSEYGYLNPGDNSDILYYTSPWEPGWVTAGLINGGATDYKKVPGPVVPEPATMSLLGMGILGLFGLKRKKV